MLNRLKRERSFDGVALGGRASVNIQTPCGVILRHFIRPLTSGGVDFTAAQLLCSINTVEVKINGVTKIQVPASYLLIRYFQIHGCFPGTDRTAPVATQLGQKSCIPLEYYQDALDTLSDRSVMGWGTADVNSFQITVEVPATPSGTTVAVSSIELYTDFAPRANAKFGSHLSIIAYPRTFASTSSQREETNLPFGVDGEGLCAVNYHQAGVLTGTGLGVLDKLRLRADNELIQEDTPVVINNAAITAAGKHPVLAGLAEQSTAASLHSIIYGMRCDDGKTARSYLYQGAKTGGAGDVRLTEYWGATAPGNFNIVVEMLKNVPPA